MIYNFYFDICAICILLAIIGVTLLRTWVPTHRNRMFMFLLLAVLGTTVAERRETLLQIEGPMGRGWYHTQEMIYGSLYFLLHLLSAAAYLTYIMALLNMQITLKAQFRRVFLLYIIGTILVFINIFEPILFYYDESGIYHRGRFLWTYYLFAGHYIFTGLIMLIQGKGVVRDRARHIMESFVLLMLTGLFIQFMWPHMLVEEFVYALALALTYITIQSPSEMIDPELRILNRKAYLSGLSADVAQKRETASIFLCVDHIESIGEQIGRKQVVALLRMIASYLRAYSRYGYLYRYSPQIFVLALREPDDAAAVRIMKQITSRFREPWDFKGMQVRMSSCVFMLKHPANFREVSDLMRMVNILSDTRLHAGRQILEVSEIDVEHAMDTRRFSSLVRASLDDGRAEVRYQPVFNSEDRRIVCYDACLMIPDPDGGGLLPGSRFIEGSEDGSTLADADEYVLHRVCRMLSTYRDAGDQSQVVSVRLSNAEITRPDFKEQLQEILRIDGIPFSMLCFKLRETTLSTLGVREEDAVNWLVARGASVVIEGFGMGYADIARLRRIHVNSIVLDHSLLEAAVAPEFMALIRGMVDMLHDIRISVVIDEVGTRREAGMAAELGCDFIQGDFLGEPKTDISRLQGKVGLAL